MCDHCGCRDLTPIARLMAEHDRLRELSGLIHRDLAADDDGAARAHLNEVLEVLDPHVHEEEGSLFPMLRRDADLAEHVEVLENEHADLFHAVDDLDEHMDKEDFGLFPAAVATLDGAQWDTMVRV